jgi:glycosyltransferase involved in cell wall biosynthesis
MKTLLSQRKVLYITYDGLTDPLGQSQILPYLKGLSNYGYRFTILSFEKKDRFEKENLVIEQLTKESGIEWVPLPFTSNPPLLSKLYDAFLMRKRATDLHKKHQFDMVHCRSYIAADVGLYLKKKYGVKFFFDMRGFWADEKKDGSWNVNHPIFSRVYKYYKRREAEYLQNADYVISLTEAGKKEMMTWSSFRQDVPVSVIPCCADMFHFSLTNTDQRMAGRAKLGIAKDALVISYLGSIGTWYMLDEMLQFFKKLKEYYATARFLIITHTPRQVIDQRIAVLGLENDNFIITQATRKDVPGLVKASDINISFIKPVYSKISSSPTKLGEVLSMGIPVIVNSGVGDVREIVEKADAGYVIQGFDPVEFEKAIQFIPKLREKSPAAIRAAAEIVYSLERGIQLYLNSYKAALS